jgi:O-antigen ligase
MMYVHGAELRLAQEGFLQMSSIILLFCLLFNKQKIKTASRIDLWLGIFGIWSVMLFLLSGCKMGYSVLTNVLSGLILYFVTLNSLEKKDISFIFKAILFVCGLNAVLLSSQMLGYDPIYTIRNTKEGIDNIGFFGLKAAMGMYYAMSISIIAYFSPVIAFFALLPIGVSVSTGAVLGGAVSYLYYLWNRARNGFIVVFIAILVGGALYVVKVDAPMGMFATRPPMWGKVVKDIFKNAITGYGLDSFRSGKIRYMRDADDDVTYRAVDDGSGKGYLITDIFEKKSVKFDWWDNPHNEYLQLAYEFGLVGVVIFLFILYHMFKTFKKAVKTKEILAICGFFIALFLCSLVQFPAHLARTAYLIPIMLALFRIETDGNTI